MNLLFLKLNNILQVLQSIFIVWCRYHFEIKVFWNGKALVDSNIFFYLCSHRVCTFICEITSILFFDESFLIIISDSSMERFLKYFDILILNGFLKSLSNSSKKHGKDISGVYYRSRWLGLRLRPFCRQLLAKMSWKQFWKYFLCLLDKFQDFNFMLSTHCFSTTSSS